MIDDHAFIVGIANESMYGAPDSLSGLMVRGIAIRVSEKFWRSELAWHPSHMLLASWLLRLFP